MLLEKRRLIDFCIVMAFLVGGWAMVNLLLFGLLGSSPFFLRKAEIYNPTEFDRVGAQLAAAEVDLGLAPNAHARLGPDSILMIVAGLSTVREDVSGPILEQETCSGKRILNIGSSGGSFSELDYYLRNLERTRLRPAVLLLGVHASWLTDRTAQPSRLSFAASHSGLQSSLEPLYWAIANKNPIHTTLTRMLSSVRWSITAPFGVSLPGLYPINGEDPWGSRVRYHGTRAQTEFLDEQWQFWKKAGSFDSATYTVSRRESEAVERLAILSRHVAQKTIFVLMPESSAMRNHIPAVAARTLLQAIGAGTFTIFDRRSAMPDSLFFDYAHLNEAGREIFSHRLGFELRPFISCTDVTASKRDI